MTLAEAGVSYVVGRMHAEEKRSSESQSRFQARKAVCQIHLSGHAPITWPLGERSYRGATSDDHAIVDAIAMLIVALEAKE